MRNPGVMKTNKDVIDFGLKVFGLRRSESSGKKVITRAPTFGNLGHVEGSKAFAEVIGKVVNID